MGMAAARALRPDKALAAITAIGGNEGPG